MADDELMIVARAQQGDRENFGLLYDRYVKKIYDFIYFKTNHKETAEDLTILVFAKALDNISVFQNTGKFSAWLYRIARNTVIDHYRGLKKDINIEDVWDLSEHKDIALDIDVKNKLQEVKKYLSRLSSEQRDLIVMRVWQDMSYREIATVLGKTEAGCKMNFCRLMKNLRSEILLILSILFLTS